MCEYLFFTGVSLISLLVVKIVIMKCWINLIGLKSVMDPYTRGINPGGKTREKTEKTEKKTFKILTYNCFLQQFGKIINCTGSNDVGERINEIP